MRRAERAIAGLWAMRYRAVVIWLGGVHPPEPAPVPVLIYTYTATKDRPCVLLSLFPDKIFAPAALF